MTSRYIESNSDTGAMVTSRSPVAAGDLAGVAELRRPRGWLGRLEVDEPLEDFAKAWCLGKEPNEFVGCRLVDAGIDERGAEIVERFLSFEVAQANGLQLETTGE